MNEEVSEKEKLTQLTDVDILFKGFIVPADTENPRVDLSRVQLITTLCIAALRNISEPYTLAVQHLEDRFIAVSHISNLFKFAGSLRNLSNHIRTEFGLKLEISIWNQRKLTERDVAVYYGTLGNDGNCNQWQFETNTVDFFENRSPSGLENILDTASGENPNLENVRWDFAPIRREDHQFVCGVISRSDSTRASGNATYEYMKALLKSHLGDGMNVPFSIRDLKWRTDTTEQTEVLSSLSNQYGKSLAVGWYDGLLNRSMKLFRPLKRLLLREYADLTKSIDHLKFDGRLTFVLAVHKDARPDLEASILELEAEHNLIVGLHWCDEVFFTSIICSNHGNLHFVDGTGGGLALARENLKSKLEKDTRLVS
jgi:hypothetical protein